MIPAYHYNTPLTAKTLRSPNKNKPVRITKQVLRIRTERAAQIRDVEAEASKDYPGLPYRQWLKIRCRNAANRMSLAQKWLGKSICNSSKQ